MQNDRDLEQNEVDDCLSLIPEIARLLNMSVSAVKRYPNDIQHILCEIYANNYKADEITLKQVLGQVVQLNAETEREIEQTKKAVPKQEHQKKHILSQSSLSDKQMRESERITLEQQRKKFTSSQGFLSREQIRKNARIISEKYQLQRTQALENERISKNENGG